MQRAILIDSQKAVDVTPRIEADEYGDPTVILAFTDVHNTLTAWMDLDPGHRNFRYGNSESNDNPSTIIIMWVSGIGALEVSDVDPFFTGVFDMNAYSLDRLANALPGSLQWGDTIGEEPWPTA